MDNKEYVYDDLKRGENKMPKVTTDIFSAEHPARKKAIRILERIAEYMGNEDMFDCKDEDTTWYDLEDLTTFIVAEKGKE